MHAGQLPCDRMLQLILFFCQLLDSPYLEKKFADLFGYVLTILLSHGIIILELPLHSTFAFGGVGIPERFNCIDW